MKYSREIEYAALAVIRERLTGQKIEHPKETFQISEIIPDRYKEEPCLIVSMIGEDTGEGKTKIELLVRVGKLEI